MINKTVEESVEAFSHLHIDDQDELYKPLVLSLALEFLKTLDRIAIAIEKPSVNISEDLWNYTKGEN